MYVACERAHQGVAMQDHIQIIYTTSVFSCICGLLRLALNYAAVDYWRGMGLGLGPVWLATLWLGLNGNFENLSMSFF